MSIDSDFKNRFLQEKEYLGTDKEVNLNKPFVSVLVTAYQQVNFIEKCLENILSQETNFRFEVIIGEDASTDGTREICKTFAENNKDKIRLYLRSRDTSQYFDDKGNFITRFNGKWNILASRGKYICICEGDDYWVDSSKLQKQVDFLESHKDYGLVFSDINVIDKNDEFIDDEPSYLEVKSLYKSGNVFWNLIDRNFVNTLTICARSEYLKEYVNEHKFEEFSYDLRYWLYISLRSKVKYEDLKFANYRVHDNGVSRNTDFFLKRKPLVIQSALIDFLNFNDNLDKKRIELLSFQLFKILRNNNLTWNEKKPISDLILKKPEFMFYILKYNLLRKLNFSKKDVFRG